MTEASHYQHTKGTLALQVFSYLLSLAAIIAAFIAWGSLYSWNIFTLNNYQFFPLFGLVGFSLLWSQYIVRALARLLQADLVILRMFFIITTSFVILAISAHPALLVYQLGQDGFGLPPESYKTFVGPDQAWLTMLGSASLVVLLAVGVRRLIAKAKNKFWVFMSYLGDLAVLAIFYHGLMLGGNLQDGWFKTLWLFYGLTLVISIIYLRLSPVLARRSSK